MPSASESLPGSAAVSQEVIDRLRLLPDFAPDATLIAEPGGRILLANARAELMFGYASGGLVGLSVEQLIPEHLRARYRSRRDQYAGHPVAHEMLADGDLAGLRKDGTTFPAEVSLLPIDAGGTVIVLDAAEGKPRCGLPTHTPARSISC